MGRPAIHALITTCSSVAFVLISAAAAAQAVSADIQEIRPGPVTVALGDDADELEVAWPDETGRMWRAQFSLDPDRPLISAITVGERTVVSAVRPVYELSLIHI